MAQGFARRPASLLEGRNAKQKSSPVSSYCPTTTTSTTEVKNWKTNFGMKTHSDKLNEFNPVNGPSWYSSRAACQRRGGSTTSLTLFAFTSKTLFSRNGTGVTKLDIFENNLSQNASLFFQPHSCCGIIAPRRS